MQPDEPAADPVESIREEPLDGPEDDLLLPSFSDMFRQTIAVSAPSDERLCYRRTQGKLKAYCAANTFSCTEIIVFFGIILTGWQAHSLKFLILPEKSTVK